MKKIAILLSFFAYLNHAHAVVSAEALYVDQDDSRDRVFLVSNSTHDAGVRIINETKSKTARLKCSNGKSEIINFYRYINPKNEGLTTKIKEVEITIPKSAHRCELRFDSKHVVTLVKDEVAFPILKELNHYQESCSYSSKESGSIDSIFKTNKYSAMSCVHEIGDIKLLPNSEDGLLGKMEILLGYRPDISFIENQNPYAELDFSKAPKLDAIFVSTLLYRHDFTGAVLARLLKFHAARGTIVNIVGTGYMHEKKDKALLKELSKFSPNIRVQEYKYQEGRFFKKFKFLTNFLRDMHVKAFVTLSSRNPKDNSIIIGGRNVHDGFVFSEKPVLTNYPELSQLGPDDQYAFWQDLEVKITSRELAKSMYAQLLNFWNREIKGQKVEDFRISKNLPKAKGEIKEKGDIEVRHMISLPFNDDSALEDLYVRLISNAKKSINISSPYLRPTPKIMEALQNAIKANPDLKVTIQTRISLAGDTQAWLYEETNKAAINELFDRLEVYEWTQNSILHTKLLLVDDEYVVLGSVNLSRRSFIQDVENALFIKSKAFAGQISTLLKSYNNKSNQIDQKQDRDAWARFVVKLLQNQF